MTRTWDPLALGSWSQGSPRATKLAELWPDQTLSTSQIGQIMGVTKNSIIGARRRLNLPPRTSPLPGISRPKRQPASALAPVPLPPLASTLPPLAPEALAPRPAPRIAQHAPAEGCRWPFGDPKKPDFRFCEALREGIDGPYCQAHRKKAYTGYGGSHG